MNSIYNFIEELDEQMRRRVSAMKYGPAEEFGMDRRAAYRLWADRDCIIVSAGDDRHLQYYAGFEYVDKDFRYELADYVVYLAEDERVRDHLEQFFEKVEG